MSYLTDQERLERFEYYIMQLEKRLLEGEDFNSVADKVPYAVHLNDAETLEVIKTNKMHSEITGHHIDEIREMGVAYLEKHIHPRTMQVIPEILPSLYSELSVHQTFNFIQYFRMNEEARYIPLITFTKATKLPNGLVVCISPIVEQFGKLSKKMEQVVEMDQFKLKHFRRFQQLTDREVEVLSLLANGYNNPKIADKLFLSRSTVETHRKNIKRKLELKSFRDLMRYSFAFDLVEV